MGRARTASVTTRLRAKERLSYDELFSHQLTLSLIREARSGGQGLRIKAPSDLQTQARLALPFELTPGQIETLKRMLPKTWTAARA